MVLKKDNKNNIQELVSDVTLTRLQSFKLPNESYDEVVSRLLRLSNVNSINDETRDKVLKIGQAGDSLNDVVNILADYYLETTRSYGIRSYIQAREDWRRVKKIIEEEKYGKVVNRSE